MATLEDIGKLAGGGTLREFLESTHTNDGTRLNLISDQPDGSINRLIQLEAQTITDRPWIGWLDQNERLVGATGFHDTLPEDEGGTQLKQYEVKTVADATGPNPVEQRTRFAIQYDVQRGTWGVNFIDYFEINQGENPILTTPGTPTPFGLHLRTTDSAGSNFVAFQALAQIDASDNVTVNLDVKNNNVAKTAQLIVGRNTNVSGATAADMYIKKCDGSNTNVLALSPRQSPALLTFGDPLNVVLGTSTGTKIGTATTQKLGFFNATPVVQQTGGSKTAGSSYTSNEQTMLQTVYSALRTYGFLS